MIIVTGGTGMLGAHILFKLTEKGYKPKAFKRPESSTAECRNIFSFYSDKANELFEQVRWTDCDITDYENLSRELTEGDTVIHAAALVSFSRKDRKRLRETNVGGTENIVNICLQKKIKKLCHISSVAALSKQNADKETDETIGEMNPNISEYSKTKYLAETEVWRGINEGLNAVILNPSVILGPGKTSSGSGSLFAKALAGNRFYTEGGTGFVDVNDTADAVLYALEQDISGERFVLNGDNISYRTLFNELADNLGSKAPHRKAGKSLLKTAAFFEKILSLLKGRSPKLTPEVIRSALTFTRYSNEKARSRLNINFCSPQQSIQKYAPYYLKK